MIKDGTVGHDKVSGGRIESKSAIQISCIAEGVRHDLTIVPIVRCIEVLAQHNSWVGEASTKCWVCARKQIYFAPRSERVRIGVCAHAVVLLRCTGTIATRGGIETTPLHLALASRVGWWLDVFVAGVQRDIVQNGAVGCVFRNGDAKVVCGA